MSTEYVRTEPGRLQRRTAPLDQRLALRLPRLTAVIRRRIMRLPPRSRLRRAILTRATHLAFSNYERGDFASTVRLLYSPRVVLDLEEFEGIAPDVSAVVEGHDALQRFLETWHEAFAWTRWTVTELIDFGDAVVFTVHEVGEGRASGAQAETTRFSAIRYEDGLIAWQRFFPARDDAIRAIGRDPAGLNGH